MFGNGGDGLGHGMWQKGEGRGVGGVDKRESHVNYLSTVNQAISV